MSLALGSTLGPYKILAQLTSGGIGFVCAAQDPRLNRQVALKILPDARPQRRLPPSLDRLQRIPRLVQRPRRRPLR